MQCLCVAGTMTESWRGVCLMEVENVVFVCGWSHD